MLVQLAIIVLGLYFVYRALSSHPMVKVVL